jgi:hypothetical protein
MDPRNRWRVAGMYARSRYYPLTADHLAELAIELRALAMRELDPVVMDAFRLLAERYDAAGDAEAG